MARRLAPNKTETPEAAAAENITVTVPVAFARATFNYLHYKPEPEKAFGIQGLYVSKEILEQIGAGEGDSLRITIQKA